MESEVLLEQSFNKKLNICENTPLPPKNNPPKNADVPKKKNTKIPKPLGLGNYPALVNLHLKIFSKNLGNDFNKMHC